MKKQLTPQEVEGVARHLIVQKVRRMSYHFDEMPVDYLLDASAALGGAGLLEWEA